MKTIYDVVERLNKDPNDAKGRKTLARMLGGYCALRLDDAGKILASETEAAIEYCEDSGDDAPKAITFAEWEKRSLKQREACPVTRRALLNGELRIERAHGLPAVSVNWSPISIPLREVAAYRAEVEGFSDSVAAVAALSAGTLPTDWALAKRDWLDLLSLPKPTLQQRSLVDRVRERLIFQQPKTLLIASERNANPESDELRQLASERGLEKVPGETEASWRLRLKDAYQGNASQAPLVVVLYTTEDRRFFEELETYMKPMCRQGIVSLWGCGSIPAGAVTRDYIARQVERAALVVTLVSADFLANFELNDTALTAVGRRQRVYPVVVRPCMLGMSPLAKLAGARIQNGTTLLDVAENIRQIVKG